MKSNGCGQFLQTIILKVALADCEAIARRLEVAPEVDVTDPTFMKLTWRRLTNRPHDDDDLVFELHRELSVYNETAWSIEWRESEY